MMNKIDLGDLESPPTKEELKKAKRICKRLKTRKTPEEILAMKWSEFVALCKRKGLRPVFRMRPNKKLKQLTINKQ